MKAAARRLRERAREVEGAQPVPSPCICVCQVDPRTGWCEGCFRTLDEIAGWSSFDDARRRSVWQHIEQRAGRVEDPS